MTTLAAVGSNGNCRYSSAVVHGRRCRRVESERAFHQPSRTSAHYLALIIDKLHRHQLASSRPFFLISRIISRRRGWYRSTSRTLYHQRSNSKHHPTTHNHMGSIHTLSCFSIWCTQVFDRCGDTNGGTFVKSSRVHAFSLAFWPS